MNQQKVNKIDITSAEFYRNAIFLWVNATSERPSDTIWITEIAGCLRKAYYDRVEPAKFEGAQSVLIFFGEALHSRLELVLNKLYGNIFRSEVEVDTFVEDGDNIFKITGRADLVAEEFDTVVEIKTCGEIPDQPLLPHKRQLQYYLNLTGFNTGVLLYIARDGAMRTFVMKRDPAYEEEMIQRAKALYYALKYRRLPKGERLPIFCNSCPYRLLKCMPRNGKQS